MHPSKFSNKIKDILEENQMDSCFLYELCSCARFIRQVVGLVHLCRSSTQLHCWSCIHLPLQNTVSDAVNTVALFTAECSHYYFNSDPVNDDSKNLIGFSIKILTIFTKLSRASIAANIYFYLHMY
jgi:hypothetical protein